MHTNGGAGNAIIEAKIIEGYGCTGWVGTSHPLTGDRVIGSIGKPLSELHHEIDCHIKIVDANDVEVPIGEEGEFKAAIVRKEGHQTSEHEIIEYCRKNIARYKLPQRVEFVLSLPKTSSGKVQHRLLVGSGSGQEKT